ncbi:YceI family protein [Sulfurospirillum arcachonense]|uniref:YceI family protein n=1 Tax=Sulfurospirillum arcachonense TaxID=57666 RepID=UPI00046AA2D6|nr:YceI family protein [Sulfurospirillum arcachonense]
MKNVFKILFFCFISFQLSSANEYVIDQTHSHLGFSIKHLMISNVKGNFKSFDAELYYDDKTKKFIKLVATIDTSSIYTGIKKRDEHLKSPDFFDIEKFSTIKFKMTSSSLNTIKGILTLNGISKEIMLSATIHGTVKDFQGNQRVGFTLTGKINRKDFDLTWNKFLESGGLAVGNEVLIDIDIEAIEL